MTPGGIVAINVLTEDMTCTDMYSPGAHCLFRNGELARRCEGWQILANDPATVPVPRGATKALTTLIAR